MPAVTTVVTKDTGGKTRPMPMTVAAPSQMLLPDQLDRMGADAQLNGRFLADLLSAFCAHERCGVHLYRTVAGLTMQPEWKQKYEEFGRETEEHIRIYSDLITRLGGDPMYASPPARLTEFLDTKLMEPILIGGSIDLKTLDLAGLECVFLAESKCHANWQFLGKLAATLPDGNVKRALQEAVQKVEKQEDEHLEWVQQTWQQTLLRQVQRV
jgi:rubrerythrin